MASSRGNASSFNTISTYQQRDISIIDLDSSSSVSRSTATTSSTTLMGKFQSHIQNDGITGIQSYPNTQIITIELTNQTNFRRRIRRLRLCTFSTVKGLFQSKLWIGRFPAESAASNQCNIEGQRLFRVDADRRRKIVMLPVASVVRAWRYHCHQSTQIADIGSSEQTSVIGCTMFDSICVNFCQTFFCNNILVCSLDPCRAHVWRNESRRFSTNFR